MVFGAIAAGLGAASLIKGISDSNRARDAQRSNRRRTLDAANRWRGILASGFPRMEARLQEQRDFLEGGFNRAQALTSEIGRSARRRSFEREREAIGGMRGSLRRRGLSNSSILDQAKRGIRYDTERSLLDIDSRLAEIRSGIEERRTGAVAGAIGNQANFDRMKMQDRADIERSLMSFHGNRQVAAPQATDFSGIASLLSVFGGGGGFGSGFAAGQGQSAMTRRGLAAARGIF